MRGLKCHLYLSEINKYTNGRNGQYENSTATKMLI